jgi:hypothetical protein
MRRDWRSEEGTHLLVWCYVLYVVYGWLVVRGESFVSLSVRGDEYTSFFSDVEREYIDHTKLEIVISFPDRMSSRRPAHLFSYSTFSHHSHVKKQGSIGSIRQQGHVRCTRSRGRGQSRRRRRGGASRRGVCFSPCPHYHSFGPDISMLIDQINEEN